MKKRFNYIFIALIAVVGCTKEEVTPRIYPRVLTIEAFNITAEGASFKGEITFSNVEINDHGFVWSDNVGPLVGSANTVSNGKGSGPGVFEIRVDRSLQQGKRYYFRAYAISDDYVVYGNTMEFVSLGGKAPIIKDFFPSIGTWGDTVTVVGENFSDELRTNVVKFGGENANIIRANRDTLHVEVPNHLAIEESHLSVTLSGNVANFPSKAFTLKAPIIESISPTEGAPGNTVILVGKFFNGNFTKVYFNGIEGIFPSGTQDRISVTMPNNLPLGPIEVKVVTGSGSLYDIISYTIKPPQLLQISPASGGEGDEIKLIGNFFSPKVGENIVTFGNELAVVTKATATELNVIVPPHVATINADVKVKIGNSETAPVVFSFLPPIVESFTPTAGFGVLVTITGKYFRTGSYNEVSIGGVPLAYVSASSPTKIEGYLLGVTNTHTGKVKVKFETQEGISAQDFRITWAKVTDYPDINSQPTAALINGDNAYVGFGSNGMDKLWRFNSNTKAWTQMASFPGQSRLGFAIFTSGTKGYCGGGFVNSLLVRDWWEYNFANDTWTKKSDLPMPGLVRGSFTFGGNGYIMTADPDGSSQVSNLWKYNHTDDSWSIVSTAPFTLYNEIRFFIVDNTIHTVAGTELWKYDHENNQWLLVSPFVASPTPQMTVAGVTYGLNAGHNMIKFDPVLNTWVDEHSAVSYYPSAMTFFAVNGRGYVISTSAVLEFEP